MLPAGSVNSATATTIPAIQPTRNPELVVAACAEKSMRMTAMIGMGEIATPIANGRMSPITPFMRAMPRSSVVAAPRTTGQLLWYPPHSINVAGRRRGRVV